MTARLVHRPARKVRPLGPEQPFDIDPPPTLPGDKTTAVLPRVLLITGAAVSITVMLYFRGSGFAAFGAVVMLICVVAAALLTFTQRGQTTRKHREQQTRYLDHLEGIREDLLDWEQRIVERAWLADPPPGELLDLVRDPARRWERRRRDTDFLLVRLGIGAIPVRTMRMPLADNADPHMLAEAKAVQRRFSAVGGLPLRLGLDRAGDVAMIGTDRQRLLGTARTVLTQIAATHAPDDVTIAIITTAEREQDWNWVRWLPHTAHRTKTGPAGPQPLIARDPQTLAALLADEIADRSTRAARAYRHGGIAAESAAHNRLLVIDDAYGGPARTLPTPGWNAGPHHLGITVLHLLSDRPHEPGEISRRVTVGDQVTVEQTYGERPYALHGTLETTSAAWAEGLARELAPLRLSPDSYDDGSGLPPADFQSLLNMPDPSTVDPSAVDPSTVDIDRLRSSRDERDFLRVPIGVDPRGRPVLLDLKDHAHGGMGPHGLCIGASGSGKSELLRSLVLALVTTHAPEQLSLVLVDYASDATFAPLGNLPHLAGLITNLAANPALADRTCTSLDGEIHRRRQMLAESGNCSDITAYNKRLAAHGNPADVPPMKHLVIVIDEVGELLTVKPEFVELLRRIGRVGRSVGVHVLLSAQSIEDDKLRELDPFLSYRLGLRTLSEQESHAVLDVPDAAHLPPQPGHGYLKADDRYEQFKSAHVSVPLAEPGVELAGYDERRVLPMPLLSAPEAIARLTPTATLLSSIARKLEMPAEQGAPIWLKPLPDAVSLDVAGGGFDISAEGVRLRAARRTTNLIAPVGVLDDPANRWQGPWLIDLSAAGGNLLITGVPGSGKTTALCTLALGLACANRPCDVGIYGLDLLGDGLRPLGALPHVGSIAGGDDRERIRRTVDEMHLMLTEREQLFRHYQLDTVADLRAARETGMSAEIACTEVVVLIDGFSQLYQYFEAVEGQVNDLLTRGGKYGIHVVATARTYDEVQGTQNFGNRIELKLRDAAESVIDRTLARTIARDQPGRALTGEKLVGQVALPRLDSVADPHRWALAEAANLVRGKWNGAVPPPVRVLPSILHAAELEEPSEHGVIPFGRFERDFRPATLELFGRDQHLLALGDLRTGKTNLLRLLTTQLMRHYTSKELIFAVFDPRHGLGDAVPDEYLGGYANNHTLASQLSMALAQELANRDPSTGAGTPDAPKIVLIVDDYDILAASETRPLSPFVPYLSSRRDLGLHVLMARRVIGAAQGLFDPFTRGVRESGCLSLLMSGDSSEGELFPGVRPATLPPGRGLCIRPGDNARTIQTAFRDPRRSTESQ